MGMGIIRITIIDFSTLPTELSTTNMTPLAILIFSDLFISITAHGMLLEPPNRSSIWRSPQFASYKPRVNFNDNELFCGGFQVQHEFNQGLCGVCGDAWNQTTPRDNEDGGIYGRGIIVARYKSGQVFDVVVNITQNHLGYFRLRLCPRESTSVPATQDCFDRNRLYFVDAKGTKLGSNYHVGNRPGLFQAAMVLPAGVTCSKCVIQWQYKAGNTWGTCKNGTSSTGCGPQETFRGCADVIIQ